MTNEIIATTISVTYRLDNLDNLYISETGSILYGASNATALSNNTAADAHLNVVIDGSVVGMSGRAISFISASSADIGGDRLVIGETGLVRSINDSGIYLIRSSEVVINHGRIDAGAIAIQVAGNTTLIHNTGTISGTQGVWLSGTGNAIDNSGIILGDIGVFMSGTLSSLHNTGDIRSGGSIAVIQTFFTSANLTNDGQILSSRAIAIVLSTNGDGNHHLLNSGLIHGGSGGILLSVGSGGSLNLVNSGEISGNEAGINAAGGTLSMINTTGGRILSAGTGSAVRFTGNLRLVNDGTIANAAADAGDDGAIFTNDDDSSARVINRGVISSTETVIDLRGEGDNIGALVLVNTGAIIGAVFGGKGDNRVQNWGDMQTVTLDAGDDILRNHGFIDGDVVLGDGSNLFDQRDGANLGPVSGGTGNDTFLGGGDDEAFHGLDGNDLLRGNGGNDVLFGGLGRDRLIGGDGDDRLNGDYGFDTPTGGANSADIMTGGAGADVFAFQNADFIGTSATTRDRITDFTHSTDKIDLSAFMAGASFIGGAAFADNGQGQVRYIAASGVLIGDVDGDGTGNWQIGLAANLTLTAGDFIFV